ncbi:lipopolysaccharide-induced tumor necrosis factor-alpha factor homolog [Pieris rapae]|uniref:lipopolysaccharide-induced tumor necrosis factor-alpha factor homolog n=1 Tax=Pieris rapae TaxID=64459 RepID=UPI001E27F1B4|nr:lipopolysaccharide-induced tumor necrosis factor-alpha factor homolog [Pieris rapae]
MGLEAHTYPPQNPPPYPGPPNPDPIMNQPQGFPLQGAPAAMGPTIIVTQVMGSEAASMICRSCGVQITTRVERMPSMRTHLFAILLCLVGCWPCSCLPYCVDTCNNADHYCSNCNAYIGSYHGV